MQWVDLFWRFLACSFLGWLLESSAFSIEQHKFVNRGFLAGPLCPIYGFGGVLMLSVLGLVENSWILVFLIGVILTTVLEYATSWGLELIFHARWWDYSNQPFNLQGRITLLHSMFWGLLSLILVYGLNPLLTDILAQVPAAVRLWTAAVVAVLIIIDLIVTVLGLIDLNHQLARLHEKILQISQRNSELGQNVKKRLIVLAHNFRELRSQAGSLSNVQRRILLAFPNLRSLKHQEALRRLRHWMKSHRPDHSWPMADIRILRNQFTFLQKTKNRNRDK